MPSVEKDIRYGMRLIKQKPWFAAVTVLILALGIGANTAIFSILDALVLRKLPVSRPDRLVALASTYRGSPQVPFSFPVFQLLEDNQRVFSSLFGWSGALRNNNMEVNGTLFTGSVRGVSGNYYGALGATALRGRLIQPADSRSTPGMPVAVISYEFWTQKFARDPGIIGKVIRIEGAPFTIIGVSRQWFMGMTPGISPEITIPLTAGPFTRLATNRSVLWIFSAGRLRDGVTIEQARGELRSFWREALIATSPTDVPGERLRSWLDMGLEARSAATGVNGDLRLELERPLRVLMALAAFILVVACVNLANLTLARLFARGREISVRVALGATRLEIIRQLLTETILLSAAGALVAFALAYWGSGWLLAMITSPLTPVILDLRPDWRVFLFTASTAILTGVVIALAPAWQTSRYQPLHNLGAEQRAFTTGTGRLSKVLIVTQIALSLVLVFGAGLLLETFASLRSFDPHFEKNSVLEVTLNPQPGGFDQVELSEYRKQLLDGVARLPGVTAASFAGLEIPAGDSRWKDSVSLTTQELPGDAGRAGTLVMVSPGFFETLGIPILSGRGFNWTDDEKHPRVAIVDEDLARRLLPGGNVLGSRVRFGVQPELEQLEVIGVARSARLTSVRDPGPPIIYVPALQHPRFSESGNLFVRAQKPAAIIPMIKSEVRAHGHEYATIARTLAETSEQALAEDRVTAWLSALFAGLALALAGVGLFGLMSYAVTRRTREIGIRMAVGAKRDAVLRLILRESLALCAVGIAIGVPCAIAATRSIAHMLFGVASADPLTFIAASTSLLAVGAAGGYWPARRAASLEPMRALRCE